MPLSDGLEKLEPVKTSPSTTSTTCTMPAASEFMIPELTATATFCPCRWKNRITSAVVATVPPTSPVKLFANCSATTGRNDSRISTAPINAIAPVNWGSGDRRNATTTQPHSALLKVVAQSISANSPMMR